MWLIDQLAEARIAAALERGELDDLPGAGRPLALDDDRMVPEELRVAYRMLKNAGYVPPEVELTREIRDINALLAGTLNIAERGTLNRRLALLLHRLDVARGDRDCRLDAEYYRHLVGRGD